MNYFELLKTLYDVYDSFEGRVVNSKKIVSKIKRALPYKECVIFSIESLSIPKCHFNVSGLYDPDRDEDGKPPILIEIAFSKRSEGFSFTEDDLSREHWAELCLQFSGILGHEYMHLHQFRKRNYNWCNPYKSSATNRKLKEQQEYYGDPDEVDAYAFTAAAELMVEQINNPRKQIPIQKLPLYKTYVMVFDKKDPVVLKFMKLTDRYYKKLEKQYNDTTFE